MTIGTLGWLPAGGAAMSAEQIAQLVSGQVAGASATFTGLPTTMSDGSAISTGDVAILGPDADGAHAAGVYSWDGAAWTLLVADKSAADLVTALTASAAETQAGTIDDKFVVPKWLKTYYAAINGSDTQVFAAKADAGTTSVVTNETAGVTALDAATINGIYDGTITTEPAGLSEIDKARFALTKAIVDMVRANDGKTKETFANNTDGIYKKNADGTGANTPLVLRGAKADIVADDTDIKMFSGKDINDAIEELAGAGTPHKLFEVADKAAMDALTTMTQGDYAEYTEVNNNYRMVYLDTQWRLVEKESKLLDFEMTIETVNVGDAPKYTALCEIWLSNDNATWTHYPDGSTTDMSIASGADKKIYIKGKNVTQFKIGGSPQLVKEVHLEKNEKQTDAAEMFKGCTEMTAFTVGSPDVFKETTTLESTWYDCNKMPDMPVINTSKVTNMRFTWILCKALTTLPMLDTSKVTDMYGLLASATQLTDFPLWDTSEVTNMRSAFADCVSLTTMAAINTSKVVNFYQTWSRCSSLLSLSFIASASGAALTRTFQECTSLLHVGGIDLANANDATSLFFRCRHLTCIGGTIDTRSITSAGVGGMFADCDDLVQPDAAAQADLTDADRAVWTNAGTCP